MERRSFLASLAALFVARRLPAAPPETGTWYGMLTDRWYGSHDGVTFAPTPPVEMSMYVRFVESNPVIGAPLTPDVWSAPRVTIMPGAHTLEEMRALDSA